VTLLGLGAAVTVAPLSGVVAELVGLTSVSVGLGVALGVEVPPHPGDAASMTSAVQAAWAGEAIPRPRNADVMATLAAAVIATRLRGVFGMPEFSPI
jgi:hypothetical protein